MDYKELARRAVRTPKEVTPAEWRELMEKSAGGVELTPEDLESVAGGMVEATTETASTLGCCGGLTNPTTCLHQC